jgi:hypothetical protein
MAQTSAALENSQMVLPTLLLTYEGAGQSYSLILCLRMLKGCPIHIPASNWGAFPEQLA